MLVLPYVMFGIDRTWRIVIKRSRIGVDDGRNLVQLRDIFDVTTLLDNPIMLDLILEISQVYQVLIGNDSLRFKLNVPSDLLLDSAIFTLPTAHRIINVATVETVVHFQILLMAVFVNLYHFVAHLE